MKIFYCTLILLAFQYATDAQNGWYLNFSPGIDFIPPAPLVINQKGYPRISFWANYESAPLKSPIYYSCRIGKRKGENGWEAELNHTKIYLKNKPDEIERFSISHGYNQVFINRVKATGKIGVKTGVGIVIGHPENTVRNLKFNEKSGITGKGYYFSGIALKYGFFKDIHISNRFYFNIESFISLAYANVPVVNGRAHVPVMGFHLQLGPGYNFMQKNRMPSK